MHQVRAVVRSSSRRRPSGRGLRTDTKPDSQDLCFVAGDYRDFIRERFGEADRPGLVVDIDGAVLGEHSGTTGFTSGQRKGLGVAVGEPRFVISIEPEAATVVVGPRTALLTEGCSLEEMSWISG